MNHVSRDRSKSSIDAFHHNMNASSILTQTSESNTCNTCNTCNTYTKIKSIMILSPMNRITIRTKAAISCLLQQSRYFSSSAPNPHASLRGQNSVQLLPSYLRDSRSIQKYHPIQAPNGAIALSVAENPMVEEMITSECNQFIPSGDVDTNGTNSTMPSDQIYYQPTQGRTDVILTMSKFLQGILKLNRPLDTDGIVLGAGCNAVLENLVFCLTELGDGILIPTPYYAAFEFDLVARIGVNVIPVTTMDYSSGDATSPEAYYPTIKAIEAACELAKAQGITPKALLLSHPQNPLGICYPKHIIQDCIDYCRKNEIHLISDEIYAASVYDTTFQSVLQIAKEENEDLGPFVHFVYALSKDFAMSGLRVGVSYTENKDIRYPLQKLNDLCQISSQTQVFVHNMLSHPTFSSSFLQRHAQLLQNRSKKLQSFLHKHNIPFLTPTAGFFLWMDLSQFHTEEHALYLELMKEYGLIFTPGESMKSERSMFFRFVFCAVKDEEFDLALERFYKFIKDKRA